jgi:hypothetical protein
MEAAKVLGLMKPTSSLISDLKRLLQDDSPEVVGYALESAGKLKRRELVPFIIQHLDRPATQRIASNTLMAYGTKIIGILKDYLGDSDENFRLRKVIPDILCQADTQRAADVLTWELNKKSEDVGSEIIEALYKMRSRNDQLHFQKNIILSEILHLIKESYLILIKIQEQITEKKKSSSATDLENDLARSLKHIFELLSLIYSHDDIIRAYQNICTGTKKAIDYSLELLDNILKKEIKEFLFPLIDEIPLEEKVKKCKKLLSRLEKTELS